MGLHSYIAQVDFERKHVICELYRANRSSSHTRTFHVLMPVGLHLVMMQTQVPRISIQYAVDPAEHTRVSVEPPCIPEDSIIYVLKFCFIRMLGGLSQHPSQYFRGFIDSQSVRKPGQEFAWGQQWFSSAGPAQGVGSGRDSLLAEYLMVWYSPLATTFFL
ncbi:hypothetical protein MTR67_033639 [Solanum verrucosum]|uniref:Uncharacterized protein n=1 Tax=Solanum verrucosum TaxID=315347 RepID=A0AAF0U6W5_SOLVR|nr:hypothetical protein MTR67_033639 [Solanum verrucosum]